MIPFIINYVTVSRPLQYHEIFTIDMIDYRCCNNCKLHWPLSLTIQSFQTMAKRVFKKDPDFAPRRSYLVVITMSVVFFYFIFILKPTITSERQRVIVEQFHAGNSVTINSMKSTPNSKEIILNSKKKVAYAITVTKDGHFVDGALVLGYSAKKVHNASKGFVSNYDADLIAFVAPTVTYARQGLYRSTNQSPN